MQSKLIYLHIKLILKKKAHVCTNNILYVIIIIYIYEILHSVLTFQHMYNFCILSFDIVFYHKSLVGIYKQNQLPLNK